MNLLDIIFLVVIFLSILFGVLKGFVRELIGMIFLFLGVYCAVVYYDILAKFLISSIEDKDVASFLAFLLIFFGVLLIGSLIGYGVKKLFVFGPLKSLDRLLGGFFGVLRGVVVCCALIFGLMVFPINENLVKNSQLTPYAVGPIKWCIGLLPASFSDQFKQRI